MKNKFLSIKSWFLFLGLISITPQGLAKGQSYLNAKTQYIQVGSMRVAYRMFGSEAGTPLVLLMHTRGNIDGWDPDLLDILASKRTVIAFDNRGIGLTDGETPNSFKAMAQDAVDFINALGLKNVDLLGFSIGGAVAQEILINHNSLVRKAIIAGSSTKGGIGVNEMSDKSKSVSSKKELTDDDLLYAFFAPSQTSQKLGKDYLTRIKQRTKDKDNAVSMSAVRAQAVARSEWGKPTELPDDRLAHVKNPILVTNGKDDIRMPTINSYNLFKTAPNAQLILYPDSGHGFLFQYPKTCGENFANFLDQNEF